MFELFADKLELFADNFELFADKKGELYTKQRKRLTYREKGLNLLNFLRTKKGSYCLLSIRQYSKAIA